MHAQRDKNSIHLMLGRIESQVLRRILALIQKEYEKKPSEVDLVTAAAWYNLRGNTHMSPDEQADWLQQMHELKSGRTALMEKWMQALSLTPAEIPVELTLSLGETPDFLAVINDHRLLTAARNEIGEQEMDIREAEEFNALPPLQQSALTEIQFLSLIMEYLLFLISREAPGEPDGGESEP